MSALPVTIVLFPRYGEVNKFIKISQKYYLIWIIDNL